MGKLDELMKASWEIALESMGRPQAADVMSRASAPIADQVPDCRPAPAASDKGKGRKLTLPDSIFERLVLTAIERGSTASAVAAEILDRNLPRLRIAADD
jgi:hypothetical protein